MESADQNHPSVPQNLLGDRAFRNLCVTTRNPPLRVSTNAVYRPAQSEQAVSLGANQSPRRHTHSEGRPKCRWASTDWQHRERIGNWSTPEKPGEVRSRKAGEGRHLVCPCVRKRPHLLKAVFYLLAPELPRLSGPGCITRFSGCS